MVFKEWNHNDSELSQIILEAVKKRGGAIEIAHKIFYLPAFFSHPERFVTLTILPTTWSGCSSE